MLRWYFVKTRGAKRNSAIAAIWSGPDVEAAVTATRANETTVRAVAVFVARAV